MNLLKYWLEDDTYWSDVSESDPGKVFDLTVPVTIRGMLFDDVLGLQLLCYQTSVSNIDRAEFYL